MALPSRLSGSWVYLLTGVGARLGLEKSLAAEPSKKVSKFQLKMGLQSNSVIAMYNTASVKQGQFPVPEQAA
jgi:hypothetical protein